MPRVFSKTNVKSILPESRTSILNWMEKSEEISSSVLKEALNNVYKHSKAQNFRYSLFLHWKIIFTMEIIDDGEN